MHVPTILVRERRNFFVHWVFPGGNTGWNHRFTYDAPRMRAGVLSAFTGTPAGDLGLIQAITTVLGVVITTKQVS